MSRMAVALMLAFPAPALAALPLTAEQAMENYRDSFAPVASRACTTDAEPEEIVVCGRRRHDARLPLPTEAEPGVREGLGPNELPTGTAAMGNGGCLRLCHQPVQIDVIGAAKAVAYGIDRLLHGE